MRMVSSSCQSVQMTVVPLLLLLLSSLCCSLTATTVDEGTYDFIVVGGGSSGAMLAARLLESGRTVLLLEAGTSTQRSLNGTTVDPFFTSPYDLTTFDVPAHWSQLSTDDTYARFQFDIPASKQSSPPSIARGLGGCSIHNAMIYVRGLDVDFARWANVTDGSWNFETVLAHYRKSVYQSNVTLLERYPQLYSVEAPIALSSVTPDDIDTTSQQFLHSCIRAGLPYLPDFNDPTRRAGVGTYQFLIRNGQRTSPAAALFGNDRSWHHEKLRIVTRAVVTRLLYSTQPTQQFQSRIHSAPVVNGVEFVLVDPSEVDRHPEHYERLPKHHAFVHHEVVLTAGAIHTPQLLMLSGIGDAAHLQQMHIPVVKHLPGVGRHLQDGAGTLIQLYRRAHPYSTCASEDTISTEFCLQQRAQYLHALNSTYHLQRHRANVSYGVLGTPGFAVGAFAYSSPVEQESTEVPDLQFTFFSEDRLQRDWSQFHNNDIQGSDIDPSRVITIEVAVNTHRTQGIVRLQSSNPLVPPFVHLPYLSDERDVSALLSGIEQVRQIVTQPPLSSELVTELLPGGELTESQLRDYILCGPKQFRKAGVCDTSQRAKAHLGGTTRMSTVIGDDDAVVDDELRVYGVMNLRIADASMMPALPSGNTHATVLMIAEHAAHLLNGAALSRERRLRQKFHDMPSAVDATTLSSWFSVTGGWSVPDTMDTYLDTSTYFYLHLFFVCMITAITVLLSRWVRTHKA